MDLDIINTNRLPINAANLIFALQYFVFKLIFVDYYLNQIMTPDSNKPLI